MAERAATYRVACAICVETSLVQDAMEWPPIGAISLSWLALAYSLATRIPFVNVFGQDKSGLLPRSR